MGAPVTHFEITARDSRRLQQFYSDLFGWKIDANNPMNYGMVDTGVKMGINGGVGQVMEGKQPWVTFYVQVENPQHYLERAVSLGANVVVPVTVVPNVVTFALFSDLEGNLVGIVEGPQAPPKEKPKRTAIRKKKAKRGKSKEKGRKRR
jgi:predicted enzyme related to lactoylglutathione lyase